MELDANIEQLNGTEFCEIDPAVNNPATDIPATFNSAEYDPATDEYYYQETFTDAVCIYLLQIM